jgi:hypothetical protein
MKENYVKQSNSEAKSITKSCIAYRRLLAKQIRHQSLEKSARETLNSLFLLILFACSSNEMHLNSNLILA